MARRVFLICVSLFLVILSLELIKAGVVDPSGLRASITARGVFACLGVGWLLACVAFSGSPVAAISLTLLDGETLTASESFSMIIGSRLGAAFVVLAVGFTYDLRTRGQRGGVYVGTLAFLTTASVYAPALGLGHLLISSDVFGNLDFKPAFVLSGVNALFSPLIAVARDATDALGLPVWMLTIVGIAVLVLAFKTFDYALPEVDPLGGRVGQMATTIFRPSIGFLIGMFVTCITLSVSLSLTILVPLTVRGLIRRENLIPYILGANITTFVDTLVVSFLVDHPAAFPIVFCAVTVVTAISLPIVFVAYRPYERLIDALATTICGRRRYLGLFVFLVFLVPLILAFT